MKKVIGILVASAFALVMFVNTGITDRADKADMSLSSLMAINIANAEGGSGNCYSLSYVQCMYVEHCSRGGSTDCSK